MSNSRLLARIFFLHALTLGLPAAALAENPPAPAPEEDVQSLTRAMKAQAARLDAQEKALAEQQKEMEEQQRAFQAEKAEFRKLQSKVAAITGEKLPPEQRADLLGKLQPAAGAAKTKSEPEVVGTERKPEQERPPEIAALQEEGGVLLKQGKFVFTPSMEYTRSSATRVSVDGFSIIPAINIGLFEISQVQRDTLTGAVAGRLGITNRFEIDAKVPYVYRSDSTRTRPIGVPSTTETTAETEGNDIGDIEAGVHYQINKGKGGWPFLIGNLRFKSDTGTSPFDVPVSATGIQLELPTGTGFYAIQPSLTAIYPSDPVVFYSNLGYLYNAPKSFGGTVGKVDPGDSVSASFGMSMSLNDRASFSLGYGHNMVFETKQNDATLPNSTYLQVGTLDLGYAYNLTDRTSLNMTVSAGVTEDAPDARIIFRVPMSFDLY